MQITTIGLDIAKNVFQVHGIDGAEKVVVRRWNRNAPNLGSGNAFASELFTNQVGAFVGRSTLASEQNLARLYSGPSWPTTSYRYSGPSWPTTSYRDILMQIGQVMRRHYELPRELPDRLLKLLERLEGNDPIHFGDVNKTRAPEKSRVPELSVFPSEGRARAAR